ncbi:MAG TPA: MOSC N-terminal beta barrel domain-containing protein [Pyrinomonadaceae bacterium]
MRIGIVKEIYRFPVKSMAGEKLDDCSVGALGVTGDRGWALRDETAGEMTQGTHFPQLILSSAHYREAPAPGFIPHVDMIFPDGSSIGSDASDVNERLTELLGKRVSLWPIQPAENLEHYRRRSKTARVFGKLARVEVFREALPALTSFGPANKQMRTAFSREPGEPIPDLSKLPAHVLEFTSPPGTYFKAFPIHLLTTASLETMARLNPSATWDVRRFRPNFLIETEPQIEDFVEAGWHGRKLRIGGVELKCEIPTTRCGTTIQAQPGLAKDPAILRTIVRDADQSLGVYASVVQPGEVKVGDHVELG